MRALGYRVSMLTRARAAVLVLAGLSLAACGSVHPGDAAVVDGRSISMKALDDVAKVYCVDAARNAQNTGGAAPDNAEIRRQAVTTLASLVVARKLAEQEGVTPKPSAYEIPDSADSEVAKAFPGIDVEVAKSAVEDSRELTRIASALGAKAAGQTPTEDNLAQLTEAGQALITQALQDEDVEFAPRFGLDGSGKQVASTLSVTPAGGEGAPDDLPAAQRCT